MKTAAKINIIMITIIMLIVLCIIGVIVTNGYSKYIPLETLEDGRILCYDNTTNAMYFMSKADNGLYTYTPCYIYDNNDFYPAFYPRDYE